jgi:hypothetical protein
MPVTDRPVPPGPWARHRPMADGQAPEQQVVRSTNRLIAIAGAAMVATSAIYLLINGVN